MIRRAVSVKCLLQTIGIVHDTFFYGFRYYSVRFQVSIIHILLLQKTNSVDYRFQTIMDMLMVGLKPSMEK
jgi:hypothetical protein